MAVGYQETVLAPRFSRVLSVLVLAVCAATESALVAFGRIEPLLRYTPAVLLVAIATLILFWIPRVRITPAELEIVNPLRTARVSWPAIRDISAKWSLTVSTVRGPIVVWAAPSPSPLGEAPRLRRDQRDGSVRFDGRRPSGAVGLVAEQLIVARWEDYRDRGLLGVVEGAGVVTTWHTARIVTTAVLLVLTIAGLAWP